jgi:tape measure domain-containing protein
VAQASIRITAETDQAQAAIQNLNKSLGNIERTSQQAEKSLGTLSPTTKLAVAAFGALAGAVGIREIVDYTARWTDLNSRLVNATGSQEAAKEALDAISRSARGTYSSLEETAKVFVRNSMAMNELGYTTSEQIKVSEALNNAIAVSGARGVEAASALDAFAQGLARGKLEGEDFNRLIENSPRIVKALADGLGVTTGELRRMITEGRITSDVMIPALISQMGKLQAEAEAMPATISDAFIVLQNSLFEFIGSTDQALGISQALSKALVFLADNTGVMVGAVGGLAVAVAALLIPLIPAATAMAILTGGVAVAGAVAVGAALGFAAQQAGAFNKNTKNAVDNQKAQTTAANEAAAAENRKVLAAQKLVAEQQKGLQDLFSRLKVDRESIGLNQVQLAIRKNIADAAKTLKVEEDKISGAVRQRIINETTALETAKQRAALDKVIEGFASEMLDLSIADKNQREIVLAIRKQELDFGRALTATEKDKLTTAIAVTQAKREQVALDRVIEGFATEMIGLSTADKDQREIVLAIRKQELEFGRALNAEEKDKLTNTIAATQAMREQAAIKEAIAEATRDQTELEKIQRGLSLQTSLGGPSGLGFVTSEKEYTRDQEALQALLDNKIISEQAYYKQREELARQYNQKVLGLEMDRIQQTMMQEINGLQTVMSARDQATVQAVGQQERQREVVRERIEFEKKSELQKTQFALEQGASIFNALGAQNKKAFEAAKAFNIANAVMNTYMGATKALATYPPPFNFIAAAAVVAAGLAQVASIRSQQYSGRQLGGPVMGGQSYIVGENGPELFTPNTTGSITRNGDLESGGVTNVNFTIVANDTTDFDQLLTSRRGLITQIISDAQLEKGRRA